jgi:methylamine utilization protein MauE
LQCVWRARTILPPRSIGGRALSGARQTDTVSEQAGSPITVPDLVRWGLAAVLAVAAARKLAAPRETRAALAGWGVRPLGLAAGTGVVLVAVEAALAAGVALGLDAACYAAAALMLGFAVAMAVSLARGGAGRPCGCFGPRSRVGRLGVARNVALGAAFAAVPPLEAANLSRQAWVEIGLAVALAAVAALAVAVLALAREVGELRLRSAPEGALEISEEGPELGSRTAVIERFEPALGARYALAVFSSQGCPLCRTLEPAIRALGHDPLVSVRLFDEERDADVWNALDVPGSPFAVALGRDGSVLAKGTFNSPSQLESILGAAERRERESVGA